MDGETIQENGSILEPLTCSETTSTQKQPKANVLNHCYPFLGVFLAILSALAVVLVHLFAKLCLVLPPFEIALVRFMVHLILTMPSTIYSNSKIIYSPKITGLLMLRGLVGTCGMLTRIYASQNMPLGDATVLMFTTPVFVAIFARIFLKERLHFIYSILLVLCLAGVVLIARPTFIFGHPDAVPEYKNILVPSLVAVSSAVFSSGSIVTIRVLINTHNVQSNAILFYFGMFGLTFTTLGSYFEKGFQFPFCQSKDYLFAVCVGICGYLVQYFLIGALKYSKAFIVAIGRTSGILFGFIFQIMIYSLVPSSLSFGGAALIATTNIVIFIFNWYQYKKSIAVPKPATSQGS